MNSKIIHISSFISRFLFTNLAMVVKARDDLLSKCAVIKKIAYAAGRQSVVAFESIEAAHSTILSLSQTHEGRNTFVVEIYWAKRCLMRATRLHESCTELAHAALIQSEQVEGILLRHPTTDDAVWVGSDIHDVFYSAANALEKASEKASTAQSKAVMVMGAFHECNFNLKSIENVLRVRDSKANAILDNIQDEFPGIAAKFKAILNGLKTQLEDARAYKRNDPEPDSLYMYHMKEKHLDKKSKKQE